MSLLRARARMLRAGGLIGDRMQHPPESGSAPRQQAPSPVCRYLRWEISGVEVNGDGSVKAVPVYVCTHPKHRVLVTATGTIHAGPDGNPASPADGEGGSGAQPCIPGRACYVPPIEEMVET